MEKATDNLNRHKAVEEARAAGFDVISCCAELDLDTWGNVRSGASRWIRAVSPGGDNVVLFRVGKHKWHCFYCDFEGTGSGRGPIESLSGGLGDVIDTDGQLRSYCRQVLDAPRSLEVDCKGLYAAQVQAYNR